jgi:hypothetical protein
MTSYVKIVVRQGQQPIGKLEGPKKISKGQNSKTLSSLQYH